MSSRLILIGLLLIGVAKAGAWWFDNFDYVTTEKYIGYRGEARYNPYLAAERLTVALGFEALSRPGLTPRRRLPPAADTVFIGDRHRTLSEDDFDTLLDWVYAGGSLVAAPINTLAADENDRLMNHLGVYLTDREERAEDLIGECPAPNSTIFLQNDSHELAAGFSVINVEGRNISIAPDQPRLAYLDLELSASGGDESGFFYLRFRIGEGSITVIADTWFSHNSIIGALDNAALLADLITAPRNPGTVWFIYDDSYPGIAALVWHHAAIAVIAFAVLLGLILWRISLRFGPLLPAPEVARRSLLEHIQATGALLWSTGNRQQLVHAARGRLLQSLERHHPGIRHGHKDEQVQLLAEHTGQAAAAIESLFEQTEPATPADFTQTIQAHQRLWKTI